jgi:hypothetical protein
VTKRILGKGDLHVKYHNVARENKFFVLAAHKFNPTSQPLYPEGEGFKTNIDKAIFSAFDLKQINPG